MEEIKFKEIIKLAIAKEIGAAYFYSQAAEKAENSDTRKVLLQFARVQGLPVGRAIFCSLIE